MKSAPVFGVRVLSALGIILLLGCGKKPQRPPEPIRPVHVVRVQDATAERIRSFAGTVRPAMESEISFRVSGEIVELPIKPGSEVKKGDLLARLDPSDYQLQEKQAEAQLRQAEAMLKQAKTEADRVLRLYEANAVSRSELDQALTSLDSAEAQRAVARKALEMARLQREYTVLLAPFDGRVLARSVELHQTVSAGQPIATVAAREGMEFVIGLPEVLIAQVCMGVPARVTVEAAPGKIFDGEVVEIGVEAGGKGTYPVRLAIRGDVRDLRVGMTGQAFLAFPTGAEGVLHVPAECVVSRPDGTHYLWVVNPQTETVEQRTVTIGSLTSAGLQILEGLQAGERVVTRGVHRLRAGVRVRVLEEG